MSLTSIRRWDSRRRLATRAFSWKGNPTARTSTRLRTPKIRDTARRLAKLKLGRSKDQPRNRGCHGIRVLLVQWTSHGPLRRLNQARHLRRRDRRVEDRGQLRGDSTSGRILLEDPIRSEPRTKSGSAEHLVRPGDPLYHR